MDASCHVQGYGYTHTHTHTFTHTHTHAHTDQANAALTHTRSQMSHTHTHLLGDRYLTWSRSHEIRSTSPISLPSLLPHFMCLKQTRTILFIQHSEHSTNTSTKENIEYVSTRAAFLSGFLEQLAGKSPETRGGSILEMDKFRSILLSPLSACWRGEPVTR